MLVTICAGLMGCCTESGAQCSTDCRSSKKQKKSTSISKTPEMSDRKTGKPLTCKLTTAEIRKRKEEVIDLMKRHVIEKKELENGYGYKFSGTDEILDSITSFIKSERQCCDFFDFKISVTSDSLVWLEISGPIGVKEFIEAELEM